MSGNSRGKLDKKARREKRGRRERCVRDAWPRTPGGGARGAFPTELKSTPTSPELQEERVLRRIALVTGQRSFARASDMAAALAELGYTSADDPDAIAEALGRGHPLEDAQDLAFAALDSRDPHLTSMLVQFALAVDPRCVDAAALNALNNPHGDEGVIAELQQIVAYAEIELGGRAFIAGCAGNLWDDVLARPYLRAKRILCDILLVASRRREAEEHLTELLALDVGDPLEIRAAVLGFALERGDVQRAGELAQLCRWSDSPVATWARALERWWNGDLADAARLVRRGREETPLVAQALLESSSSPEGRPLLRFDMKTLPSPARAQALFVEVRIGCAWRSRPEAIAWLAAGAHATIAEQRETACASFGPPVSSLLAIGGEGLGPEWIDYGVRCGLAAEDTGELLRMATDPVMSDLAEADPRSHASSHAWRALASLGATDAVEPLLRFHVVRLGHQRMFAELHALLARIGVSGARPMVDVLKDTTAEPLLRGLACESLAHLAGEHALLRQRAVQVMSAELDRSERNEPELNAWLVLGLVQLRAVEHSTVIRRAFELGRVSLSIAGDWESVALELEAGP
jgi:hypothetical protein